MNCQTKALFISLAVHTGLISLVITISCSFGHPEKPVLIDFTLLDSKGLEPSSSEKTAKQSPPALARPKATAEKQKMVAEKPRIANVMQSLSNPVTAPSTEPTGTVAVPPAHSTAPAPVPPTVRKNGPSGDATGKSGREAGSSSSGSGTGPGQSQGEATAGNGTGNASEQMRNSYLKEHFEYIRGLIQKNLVYPARARRMGWAGRTVVSFTIQENGRVQNVRILNSSGYDLLDYNVLETIRKVEPFPKPPVRAELKIPFMYRLEQ